MVCIGSLFLKDTVLLHLKGKNAWYPLQMAIRHQSDGLRAEMNVGTGNNRIL